MKGTFSLRTVLALVTLFGVAFAWLAAERRVVAERQAVVQDHQGDSTGTRIVRAWSGSPWPPPSFPWFRRILGDAPIQVVYVPAAASDKDKYQLARLFPEAHVLRPSELPWDFPPLGPRDPAKPWRVLTLATAAFVMGYAVAAYRRGRPIGSRLDDPVSNDRLVRGSHV